MKRLFLLLTLLMSISFFSQAQDLKPVLSLTTAQKILQGCLTYADSARINVAIAIYDTDARLIHFARMNGASLGAANVAQWKGISAATYQNTSAQTASWNVPTAPDIATVPGGVPINTKDGHALGGVGVSGAASAVDVKCAEAGLRAAGYPFVPKK